jgi:hypothetical protein
VSELYNLFLKVGNRKIQKTYPVGHRLFTCLPQSNILL